MSLRLRLLVLLLAIYGVGGFLLTRWALNQVRPRYLESMEESLVDTSVLLASVLETQSAAGRVNGEVLRQAFAEAARHEFEARIFSLRKTAVDLRVYVTDDRGRVVFDSAGRSEGQDFSRWNDVHRTLLGQYGARSTRDIAANDETQVIYVAAPVRLDGRIAGVLSVGKPTHGINLRKESFAIRTVGLVNQRELLHQQRNSLAAEGQKTAGRLRNRNSPDARCTTWAPLLRRCATPWRVVSRSSATPRR